MGLGIKNKPLGLSLVLPPAVPRKNKSQATSFSFLVERMRFKLMTSTMP